jgi:ATP-dependent helicase/nuclease subunit A
MSDNREQHRSEYDEARRIVRDELRSTLFVEAGAGTGKTSALVDRVVALVESGIAIERIVAITFTEKAAAELRDRVRAKLEEFAGEAWARAALDGLDRAPISTIHAFGLLMMKSFAAEAATDPAFVMQDEMRSERRFEEQWRLYLSTLHEDAEAKTAIGRALGLGMTTKDLQKLAKELSRLPGLATQLDEQPLVAEDLAWPGLGAIIEEIDGLGAESVAPGDRLRIFVDELRSLVERIRSAGSDQEPALANGASLLGKNLRIGTKGAWQPTVIDDVRTTLGEICARLTDALARTRSQALAQVLPYIVRFVVQDAAARRREGLLVFDDVIVGPRDVLQTADTARILRLRYDVMLIDEFQDTDPLQVDIATAFACDPDTGALEPGRLFLVGDPKQSIYRFRRADMAVYERTRRLVEAAGALFPALALNHRSQPAIIDWVNTVFGGTAPGGIIGEGDQPHIQPRYAPIHAARAGALHGPGVAVMGDAGDLNARRTRQVEAEQIALRCAAVLCDHWGVANRSGGEVRPAQYRDIAVLIPTRAVLAPLERAFRRERIPYRVEGGSLIYATQEVRDLLNCLAAIDDPADEVAVVGALRGLAFGCSDVELARHKRAGGRFNYLGRDTATREGPVADALRVLKAFHGRRHELALATLVEKFVAERGQDETGILIGTNRDSFRRMRFVVEQARSFEANGPESLRAFVAWMEQRATSTILDREGAGLDDDEDAVRILTVHGAKGLEFPIVFVAGLSAAPMVNFMPTYAVDRIGGNVAVHIGTKSRNSVFDLGDTTGLHAAEQDHIRAEFQRLLYVAATRARDHLIVSLYHTERAKECGARILLAAGAQEGAIALPELTAAEPERKPPFADLTVELPGDITTDSFTEAREALVQQARKQRYTSATALATSSDAAHAGEPHSEELAHEARRTDETEPWKHGRGATNLGRAVHATIQSLPLDAEADQIEAYARAQAVAEAIPQRASDVARLVTRALASDAATRARTAKRALREVPFAVQQDGTIVEGFIDMVIETDDGLEIVDWKTDQIAESEVPARLQQYELQAGLYVLGLEAATGRTVTRITYVFASPAVEASPGEPAALSAAAQARVGEM